jgi:DNA (cytosine-5)-methyltransferase 1
MRTLNGSLRIKDPRNDLLFQFYRFAEGLRPRVVMLENVPGLADDKKFRLFLKLMGELGYIGDYRVLNAADYGVAQRRRRLIYLAGFKIAVPFAQPVSTMKTVRDAIGRLPKAGKSGDAVHDLNEQRSERVMDLIRRIPRDGGSRTDLPRRDQLACHKRCNGFKDVYGRMAWDEVAPTITSGCFNPSKGRFVHPEEDRAITIREAALLQGFPRRYEFPVVQSKSALALLIGNALPPPFIRHHAKRIHKILTEEKA